MTLLFSIKKNTLYDQDSLTKKARTSLSNFLPNLKRKRSFEEEEYITVITKKKKINTMTRLFQKIAMSTTNSIKRRDKTEALFDALYKFETFSLPIIEPTDGSLGIILKEKEEEDSIFSTNEGSLIEFPVPPSPPPPLHKKKSHRLRQDSCPPRLNSLVIIEEESDDDSPPLTPSSSTSLDDCELLKKMHELHINIV